MTLQTAVLIILEAIVGYLATQIVAFIRTKSTDLKAKTESELTAKYIDMAVDTVTRCVITTNQTYVNTLKEQGNFTPEAQKKAFDKTYEMVMAVLSDDAKEYLVKVTGDFDTFLKQLIESQVATEKK